jgi:alcohol dehydrogenase class IV
MDWSQLREARDWSFPVPIAYGPGRLAEIGMHCAQAGMSRPLIVTDRGCRELDFVRKTREYLRSAGMYSAVYADISPNPRDDEIAAGCAHYHENGHDGVVAIGGGSGMDGDTIDLWRFNYDECSPNMTGQPFPPLICIPTTAGTGAETESTAMITDTTRGMKLCIWHPQLKPSVALLDPELTLDLPPDMTAWTGCDAMIHAIEAYCVPDLHPLCDGAALEGLRLVHACLPAAVADGRNIEARGGMLIGSCLAGIAFLKGLGLVHAISHMIGAEYDTHHGLTNAVVLPAVLRFNAPFISERVSAMAAGMQLKAVSFDGFYEAVCNQLDAVNIPRTLADIGVPADCAAEIARRALQDAAASTNPRAVDVEEIQAVIEDVQRTGR